MKIKDRKFVKDYFDRIKNVVNWMELIGETSFTDQNIEKKIIILVSYKFEINIYTIKKSYDLQTLTNSHLFSR